MGSIDKSVIVVRVASLPLQQVSSNSYPARLLAGLDAQRRSPSAFCDYTIIADEVQIRVHRCVLAAGSDYFRALMACDMRESREDQVTNLIVLNIN